MAPFTMQQGQGTQGLAPLSGQCESQCAGGEGAAAPLPQLPSDYQYQLQRYDDLSDLTSEDLDLGFDPAAPTSARPGSEEKVMLLGARYAAGLPLWHVDDCTSQVPENADLFGPDEDPLELLEFPDEPSLPMRIEDEVEPVVEAATESESNSASTTESPTSVLPRAARPKRIKKPLEPVVSVQERPIDAGLTATPVEVQPSADPDAQRRTPEFMEALMERLRAEGKIR